MVAGFTPYAQVVADYRLEVPLGVTGDSPKTAQVSAGPVERGRLYTLREASRLLRLDRSGTLSRAIEDGLVQVIRVGAATRVSGEELARIHRDGLPALAGGRRLPTNAKRRAPSKKARPSAGSIRKIPL